MSFDHHQVSPMFRIDVSPETEPSPPQPTDKVMVDLLRQLVDGQQQQNRMLEALVGNQNAAGQQRNDELSQWKEANPDLADKCRLAAETLSRVQAEFLDTLADEVNDSEDYLVEGDYMLNEFIDRFGPRMAHLNGVLQVLAQLGSEPAEAS
ncbi:MAG: hypothetical protein AAF958_12480 [Planctomycetota bacterium]